MKSTLCLLLLALLTQPAHADSATKLHKVEEMLIALRLEETTNRLEKAQEERIQTVNDEQLKGVTLEPDQQKSYD